MVRVSLEGRGAANPGALDRRVRLDYPSATRSSDGGEVVTWFEAANVWASRTFNTGGRLYAADAKHYDAGLTYRIRARTDVAPGWRLVHGDDVFEITAVEELGRLHLFELSVRAIDQTPHTSLAVFRLHDATEPFLLHGGQSYFLLHREQDAA